MSGDGLTYNLSMFYPNFTVLKFVTIFELMRFYFILFYILPKICFSTQEK